MELTDGVVRLRAPRESDVPALVATCNDPGSRRWTLGLPEPYGEEQALEFLATARRAASDGTRYVFAIAAAETDELLGSMDVRIPGDVADVGYMVSPQARARGIATRALVLASRWALRDKGVARLELTTHPDNVASQRVAEKAGFVREGVLRDHAVHRRDGTRRDSVMFSLLPRDLS